MAQPIMPPREQPLAAYSYSAHLRSADHGILNPPVLTAEDLYALTYNVHNQAIITRKDIERELGYTIGVVQRMCSPGKRRPLPDHEALRVLDLYMSRLTERAA